MDQEQFLEQILEHAYETGSFNSLNLIEKAKHICIWGTGRMFHEAYEQYFVKTGIKVDYLCDNAPEKWGKEYLGIPCISPAELELLEHTVVIPLIGNSLAVEKQLRQMKLTTINQLRLTWDIIAGLPKNKGWFWKNMSNIKKVYDLLEDARSKEVFVNILCNRIAPELSQKEYEKLYDTGEYFCPNIPGYTLGQTEVFCDAGAYTGDTIEKFVEYTGGKFQAVHAFEFEPDNYLKCCTLVESMDTHIKSKIYCNKLGVPDHSGGVQIGYEKYGSAESNSILKAEHLEIKNERKTIAKLVRLDEYLKGKEVSLLKMDIEGEEQNALCGANGLLSSQNPPKLAICIYHKLDDMWEVPLRIKEMMPSYKIDIRHHAKDNFWGTVCYAYV